MRFLKFVDEATGIESFNRHFGKGKGNVETITKEDAPIWGINGGKLEKTGEVIPKGDGIIVPDYSDYVRGKVDIIWKGRPLIISYSKLEKKSETGGEQLRMTTEKLTRLSPSKPVNANGIEFKARLFETARELSNDIEISIKNIKTVPEDLLDVMIHNLRSDTFSKFDWKGYPNISHKKEVAKYYGEVLLGLCLLNGEKNAVNNCPISPSNIKRFIVPVSPSFKGIDSMFEMKDKSYLMVSNKSGTGAAASFHANLIPKLVNYAIKGGKIQNNLLKYMVHVAFRSNPENVKFLYDVGINYLMGNKLKGRKGVYIKNNPYQIYENIRDNNITEYEEYVMDVVKNNTWPKTSNQKVINDKLPQSLTYFICQNLAELLNSDKKALDFLKSFLTYWQANLNTNKFIKTGDVKYNMIETNKGRLKITPGKGSMKSVRSNQGRLSYEIR